MQKLTINIEIDAPIKVKVYNFDGIEIIGIIDDISKLIVKGIL